MAYYVDLRCYYLKCFDSLIDIGSPKSFQVSGIYKCPQIMHNSDARYKLQESKLVSASHILRHCSHLHGDLMICDLL